MKWPLKESAAVENVENVGEGYREKENKILTEREDLPFNFKAQRQKKKKKKIVNKYPD